MSDSTASSDGTTSKDLIKQRVLKLERQAMIVFAARCAWRAAPWLIADWRDEKRLVRWLEMHLSSFQQALVTAMVCGRGERVPFSSDSIITYEAYRVLTADAATTALGAALADSTDETADLAAQAASAANYVVGKAEQLFLAAIDSDLSALENPRSAEGVLQQPLWPKIPTELESLWIGWKAVIAAVPAVDEFLALMQRIHYGEPNWEHLMAVFGRWSPHPENSNRAEHNTPATKKKPPTTKPKPKGPTPKPAEASPRRIIDPHLVSTKSVVGDSEAEKLTPTAQRCMLSLREFLVSDETRPPLTVAVEAPWGGGKSSLMRHLQDSLMNKLDKNSGKPPFAEEPIPTVWFNPWKHEAGKTLWAAFAVAFERQMAEGYGRWERLWKRVCLSIRRLGPIEKAQLALRFSIWTGAVFVLGFVAWEQAHAPEVNDWKERLMQNAPWVGMIATMWAFFRDAVKQLGSPLKLDVSRLMTHNDHVDKVDDLHRFHEDFRRLMRAYTPKRKNGQPGKVVVFIDDLDRCEAPKAADLLQSLHLMLNVQESSQRGRANDAPGVICVLGMDREKVAAAVAAKHEKLLPYLMKPDKGDKVGPEQAMIFGHEFLEKFIQLTLNLPPLHGRDLEEYLESITGAKSVQTALESPKPVANAPVTPGGPAQPPTDPTPAPSSSIERNDKAIQEEEAAKERIERVNEDLDDGRVALQCARYVAAALENNPRKLKQFVNLFRLRLYLAAAMNVLDLPERDADKSDPEPLRPASMGKLSVHHLAKLVALELAAPSEMATLREKSPDQIFNALEFAFPLDQASALHALVIFRDPYEPEAYDLSKAALGAYFHHFQG